MSELAPEQSAFFERALRIYGAGDFRKVIEEARDSLVKRGGSSDDV